LFFFIIPPAICLPNVNICSALLIHFLLLDVEKKGKKATTAAVA
jgi:hypothetical protein